MTSRMSRSSHGGKPFSANRTRVEGASKTTADGQKYPEIKQRGFYSDIIGTEADVAVSLYIYILNDTLKIKKGSLFDQKQTILHIKISRKK